VLDEQVAPHSLTLTLAAQGSSQQTLLLKENAAGLKVRTEDGKIGDGELVVSFPAGAGYVTKTVTLSW
jgi:hypothetical protein